MQATDSITVTDLSKTYGSGPNEVQALRNLSATFGKGTFTAIMGPSGSGKSTLLQCMAGLEYPTSGHISLADKQLEKMNDAARTKLRLHYLGFVFQSFNLLSALTAQQNVALPLRLAGKRPKASELQAVLEQVGLGERAGHLPSQLSGGQQQRVAIARALAVQPEVLFADEPTGALDSNSSKEVLHILRQLVDKKQQTVVMVTHDPVAASYAHTVIFLVDGALVGSLPSPNVQEIARYMTSLEKK